MKRTISLKLKLSNEQHQVLLDLQDQFCKACNAVVEFAEKEQERNRVRLHHLSYYALRGQFPQLGSQMACNAIAKIAFCLKALKKPRKIVFRKNASVHFDKRTYALKDNLLSLFTLQGRIKIPLRCSAFHLPFLQRGVAKEAELILKKNRWFFNLVVDLPDVVPKEKKGGIAVDLGENNLAATSTGKLFGGGALKHQRDKYLGHRSRLQSNGSQSARQRLKKISGKERRHVRHVNHCVSKCIIEEAKKNESPVIFLENLKNIRERIKGNKKMRSRLHRWSFDELRQFVEYKAEAEGIRVIYLNPAYTSQTCSTCYMHGSRTKHLFVCSYCGSRQHSDLNASRNLLRLGMSADIPTGDVNHRHVAA